MANSYQEYTSGLTGTSFTGFNVKFISQEHLKVATSTNNGSSFTTGSLTVTVNGTTATLSAAPNTGNNGVNKIRIFRETGTAELVDFQSGSRITESDLDTSYRHAVYAAQEVLENAPAKTLSQQGPAGADGVGITSVASSKVGSNTTITVKLSDNTDSSFVISDGTDGSPGTNSSFSKFFQSSETAIPASQTKVELDHSLAEVPKYFQWVLRCKSAENGYAVGDEIDLSAQGHSAGRLGLYANATKCFFVYDTKLTLPEADASNTWDVTNADTNWKLICRAFA